MNAQYTRLLHESSDNDSDEYNDHTEYNRVAPSSKGIPAPLHNKFPHFLSKDTLFMMD